MDKQKQIDEMAKSYCMNKYKCNTDCVFQKTEVCEIYETCENLYNAGYRKIDKNAVVLTSEEYDELCCSIGVSREEVDRVVDIVEKDTRKETAEKFAERLKEEAFVVFMGEPIIRASKIDEIANEITEGKV